MQIWLRLAIIWNWWSRNKVYAPHNLTWDIQCNSLVDVYKEWYIHFGFSGVSERNVSLKWSVLECAWKHWMFDTFWHIPGPFFVAVLLMLLVSDEHPSKNYPGFNMHFQFVISNFSGNENSTFSLYICIGSIFFKAKLADHLYFELTMLKQEFLKLCILKIWWCWCVIRTPSNATVNKGYAVIIHTK